MFSYHAVKDRPTLLLAMTSLTHVEFEALQITFQHVWDAYVQQAYQQRPDRERQYGGGQLASTLVAMEDKLLFILYYLKAYPLQEILAFEFDMAQSTANAWIHVLTPILQEALDRGGFLPERDPTQVVTALAPTRDQQVGIDGTERRRQRPSDPATQQDCYSGKKKTHTMKNLILAGLGSRTVAYLSTTVAGRIHDKTLADQERISYPSGIDLYQDTGFQGYAPSGVQTQQPTKKPKGKELSPDQRAENTLIASIRIGIEHIIAGIKRCRIVKEVFRNTKLYFDDLVIELACGLHNFRMYHRYS
jgi:hypothetical protein